MMTHAYVGRHSAAPLVLLGSLSLAAGLLGTDFRADPLAGWLLSLVLLATWIVVAVRLGPERLRPRWLVVMAGAMVALEPLAGLLPANRCLIFGPCVF